MVHTYILAKFPICIFLIWKFKVFFKWSIVFVFDEKLDYLERKKKVYSAWSFFASIFPRLDFFLKFFRFSRKHFFLLTHYLKWSWGHKIILLHIKKGFCEIFCFTFGQSVFFYYRMYIHLMCSGFCWWYSSELNNKVKIKSVMYLFEIMFFKS